MSEYPTYSAFGSVFGVTCPRSQPLASSGGFGTTARLGARKNPSVARRGCARRWRVVPDRNRRRDGFGGRGNGAVAEHLGSAFGEIGDQPRVRAELLIAGGGLHRT